MEKWWADQQKWLDEVLRNRGAARGSLEGNLGYLARIVKRLGDRVFAEERKGAEEAQKAIIEGLAKLAGVGPMAMHAGVKPTPRFNVGDEVELLCDGASPGHPKLVKGLRGTVAGYEGGSPLVKFDVDTKPRNAFACREDQLELVPKRMKQPCYKYDCIRNESGDSFIVTSEPTWHKDDEEWCFSRSGETNWGRWGRGEAYSWTLVAAGPNHPKD